jgi:hypothetical protein
MRRNRRWAWISTAVVSLALAGGGEALACPNCKEAVAAQPADVARMAEGYNWSIMLMLGVPFGMVGAGAFFVRRAVRLGILPEM